jgi:Ribonuclease G/E
MSIPPPPPGAAASIIVVDFIDLQNRNKRDQIINALREAVGLDPAIDWVGNMSRLGLVEMLRKRSGLTLAEMWGPILNREAATHG